MSYSGKDHSYLSFISSSYDFVVRFGAARLDYGRDTGLGGNFKAIGHRKKCIGGHYGASGPVSGTFNCHESGIYSRGLPHADADSSAIFGQYYRIRFGVLDNFPGKK